MICPTCSKNIPSESKFCLHCGARIPTETPIRVKNAPSTLALEIVEFRACGPPVSETGYLNERLRRGFEFAIGLSDSNGQGFKSDGELMVALRGPYPNASSSPHLLGPILKTARSIGTRTDILWHRSFVLKASDFELQTIPNASSVIDNPEPKPVYVYRETAPILSVDADYAVELHAWFIMPTGQILYQAAVTLWSR